DSGGEAEQEVPDTIDRIGRRVSEIEDELDEIDEQIEAKQEIRRTLETVDDLDLDLDAFQDYSSIDIYLGTVDDVSFTDALVDGRTELVRDG
ncbi:MAG: hypothetical protein ABEK12_01690, partial [Candidatus Nanohaloarchaea archaeon]